MSRTEVILPVKDFVTRLQSLSSRSSPNSIDYCYMLNEMKMKLSVAILSELQWLFFSVHPIDTSNPSFQTRGFPKAKVWRRPLISFVLLSDFGSQLVPGRSGWDASSCPFVQERTTPPIVSSSGADDPSADCP